MDSGGSGMLQRPSFFARVSTRDGRVIEEALAGSTLLNAGARLDGAVIEATYAAERPPLLKRLGDDRVPRMIDPQSLRLVGTRFTQLPKLQQLPYAPERPITVNHFDAGQARSLARGALHFAQDRGAELYLTPGLPLADKDLPLWIDHNDRILHAACAANGSADIDRRPLLALIAPGAAALRDPALIVDRLLDYPIDGVYVQALNLQPTRDPLEKLARFVQFLAVLQDGGVPVMVGRVGAFGLLLQALGVTAFDSGLGQAEGHDLASLNRALTDRELERRAAKDKNAGPSRRVYLEALKTTLKASHAHALLTSPELRHHFACTKGCCRFRALEELPAHSRSHYLFARRAEVDALARLDIPAMRLTHMEQRLRAAADLGVTARRLLPNASLPTFEHLPRWLGLLAREQDLALSA